MVSRAVRIPDFCICEKKGTDQLRSNCEAELCSNCEAYQRFAVTAKLLCAFVFATRIIQFLFFLNPKFQTSSLLLWLYRPDCVGLCQTWSETLKTGFLTARLRVEPAKLNISEERPINIITRIVKISRQWYMFVCNGRQSISNQVKIKLN